MILYIKWKKKRIKVSTFRCQRNALGAKTFLTYYYKKPKRTDSCSLKKMNERSLTKIHPQTFCSVFVSYLVLFESEVIQNKMIDFKFSWKRDICYFWPLREFCRVSESWEGRYSFDLLLSEKSKDQFETLLKHWPL